MSEKETPQEFLARMRSISVVTSLTKDRHKEIRHPEKGYRMKETTDELGNKVTQHAVGDRQDVLIRPETVRVTKEELGL